MPQVSAKCLSPDCRDAPQHKGLCMKCYSAAKKMVEEGKTSWEELASMGLAIAPASLTQFEKAFNEKKKES